METSPSPMRIEVRTCPRPAYKGKFETHRALNVVLVIAWAISLVIMHFHYAK